MRKILFFVFIISAIQSPAQMDTIRVLQYNLLNFGNSANLPSYKKPRLSTIVNYVKPDIFGINEMRNDSTLADTIRLKVLDTGWRRGYYSNTHNEVQANMLFWKASKFTFRGQQVVCTNLRDIVAYKLAYKDSFTTTHDTVKLIVIVAHLKASSGSAEEADRAAETQLVRNYLNNQTYTSNVLFMGDFNLYGDYEQAYQNVIAGAATGRMYDPISRPGAWHANISFADIHTQATRTVTTGDGGVTGGIDDRFDFILESEAIHNGGQGMRSITSTYRAVGEDGQHFNSSLLDAPSNTSVPPNVLTALYEMSDHLPVTMNIAINATQKLSVAPQYVTTLNWSVANPFSETLKMTFAAPLKADMQVRLYNITGQLVATSTVARGSLEFFMAVEAPAGFYVLRLQGDGINIASRLIKE